jgi:hypothetical protein
MLRRMAVTLLLIFLCGAAAFAQEPPTGIPNGTKEDAVKEADEAYVRKDLPTAARLYLKAIESGSNHIDVFVKTSRVYALMGKKDEAFRYLEKGIETGKGLERIRFIGGSADFASLQTDSRWAPLMKKYIAAWEPYLKQPIGGNPLRMELFRMVAEDQIYRNMLNSWEKAHGPESSASDEYRALMEDVRRVDAKNTARLKEIVEEDGWPGKSSVGEGAAADAWLLVQHADADRAFQKHCLELMKPMLAENEISRSNYAYLTDRILVSEGRKQFYGTQFTIIDGDFSPEPIEDEANVDKRRKEMGMGTLEEYKQRIRKMYGVSKKP